MTTKRLLPAEITLLRATLKLSEGEFANRIELDDRRLVKQFENGSRKPSPQVTKLLFRLLSRGAGRSPKLKKLLETVNSRVTPF
jgi:DNA-binding transcriptional regulator YiaG